MNVSEHRKFLIIIRGCEDEICVQLGLLECKNGKTMVLVGKVLSSNTLQLHTGAAQLTSFASIYKKSMVNIQTTERT